MSWASTGHAPHFVEKRHIPFLFLVSETDSATGLKTGLVLLAAAGLLALPFVSRNEKAAARAPLIGGVAAAALAALGFVRLPDTAGFVDASIGVGLVLAAAGAALMIAGTLRAQKR